MLEMDVQYLTEILNSSKYAIIAMDLDLTVTFINLQAKKMFKISDEEILGKHNPFSLGNDIFNFSHDDLENRKRMQIKRLRLENSDVDVKGHISPVFNKENNHCGYCIYVKKLENSAHENKNENLFINGRVKEMSQKRSFSHIRHMILSALVDSRKTINQIAKDIEVNWKTVENHLTYLMGKKFISEVFSSKYVRIFKITEAGKRHLIKGELAEKEKLARESSTSSTSASSIKINHSTKLKSAQQPDQEINIENLELSKEVEK